MLRILTASTATLASLILAAHALRWGWWPLVVLCVALPMLLLVRRPWALPLWGVALTLGVLEWLRAGLALTHQRMAMGEPWVRAAFILGGVTLFTAVSALPLRPWRLILRPGQRGAEDRDIAR